MMNWKEDELWDAVSRKDVDGVRTALRKVFKPVVHAGARAWTVGQQNSIFSRSLGETLKGWCEYC